MASSDNVAQDAQTSSDFFQSIGSKVADIANTNGSVTDDNDPPAVDEIESLCMNCHDNVSLYHLHIPF